MGRGLSPERLGLATLLALLAAPAAASDFTIDPILTAQLDAVSIDGQAAQSALEIRRLRLGARGAIGPSFAWVAEIDAAQGSVRLTNFYVALTPEDAPISLVVGQAFPPTSLETLSTANGSSFLERAQMHDLFAFGRRFGAVLAYHRTDVLVTASVFGNDINGSFSPGNKFVALRGVWAPELGEGRLHLGANVKWREAGSLQTLRYAARQGSALLDTVLLDTGRLQATGDTNVGVELAGVFGQLSFASEVQRATLQGGAAGGIGSVRAGYAEVGWYFTQGDQKVYELGRFGRTRPARPLGNGGSGAWQASVRGDWSNAGARQQILSASLQWIATANFRMIAQVSRVHFDPHDIGDATNSTLVGMRTHYIF